jgi:hypothetical protein
VEPTVIAPDGAEVLLVAMTPETKELTASKRRMLNQSEVNYANSYSMKLIGSCQNIFRMCSGKAGFIKADTRMPRKLIIPAMYRSEVKATNFSENSAIIQVKG